MASVDVLYGVIFVLFLTSLSLASVPSERHVKFQYKHSFKGPHLVNKEGAIPFWNHGGSAIPSDEQIRLTPSMTNKKGYAWTKNTFPHDWWEVEVAIKVTGRGRLGGDGIAIWYTETAGVEGPAFGNANTWKGLGVFCDSFDNDQQGNNPFISVMLNDGSQVYDHNKDGQDLQLGGCLRDFRNRPNPVRLKLRYYENVFTLWVHTGMSTRDDDFELCTRLENITLHKNGFFGLSAATGGLADDHDVLSFITHSLTPPKDSQTENGMSEEEQRKLSEQYEEYQKKLEQQREDYKTAHPDKVKRPETEYENVYERDVRLVYEGQNAIHQMISNLHTKVGELTVQVNTLYTLVTSDHNQIGQVVKHDQTINRQEVNTLINMQQQLSSKLQDISNLVNQRGNVEKRDVGDSAGVTSKLDDMQNAIESLTHSVNTVATKQQMIGGQEKKDCPPPPPMPQCIGPGYFVVLIVAQLFMLIGYIGYKNQKEAAAKKFF